MKKVLLLLICFGSLNAEMKFSTAKHGLYSLPESDQLDLNRYNNLLVNVLKMVAITAVHKYKRAAFKINTGPLNLNGVELALDLIYNSRNNSAEFNLQKIERYLNNENTFTSKRLLEDLKLKPTIYSITQ